MTVSDPFSSLGRDMDCMLGPVTGLIALLGPWHLFPFYLSDTSFLVYIVSRYIHICASTALRVCLVTKIFGFVYCNTFVCIYQLVSNYGLIRFKIFVLWFSIKMYN
jgi:hypothetical protein